MSDDIDEEMDSATKHYSRRLSVEEFFIDFLGGLVPGTLFIVAIAFTLIPSFHALWAALWGGERLPLSYFLSTALVSIQNTPSAIWVVFFFAGALFAYVVGHLFYRYDPKKADKRSFTRLARSDENENNESKKYNLGCTSEEECNFPYPDYDKYLERRGLKHLELFIVWKGEERNWRSKTYINLLKVRLRYYHPEKCGAIIRNEAHVRLASSTWRVSQILSWISLVSISICVIALVITLLGPNPFNSPIRAFAWHIPAILPPTIVLAFSIFAKWEIEGFLHYQRLREVFFVLETAYTAFQDSPQLLNPPFKLFGQMENDETQKEGKIQTK